MLSTKEAAQRLGLKTSAAVRQLILAGRLKAEKRGRDWWIEEADLIEFERKPRRVGRPKGADDSQIDSQGGSPDKTEGRPKAS